MRILNLFLLPIIVIGALACERTPGDAKQTADSGRPEAVQACDLSGYVAAPGGVTIQGLSRDAGILRLPPESIVNISGFIDGRLRIMRAVSVEEEVLFAAESPPAAGWIDAGFVVTATEPPDMPPASDTTPDQAQGVPVYAAPDGAELDRLAPYDAVNILGCRGAWAYIEGTSMEGEIVRGWLGPDAQCPNPVSSCS